MISELASGARGFWLEHAFLNAIRSYDTKSVRRQVVNWSLPMEENLHPVQVKEHYGNLVMVTCRPSHYNLMERTKYGRLLCFFHLRVSAGNIR